jgi:NADH:ubiquinone oxidoreductase subunit 4 (subunit M)
MVAYGPLPAEWAGLSDLTPVEAIAVTPLALAIVVLGVWPALVADAVAPVVTLIARTLGVG